MDGIEQGVADLWLDHATPESDDTFVEQDIDRLVVINSSLEITPALDGALKVLCAKLREVADACKKNGLSLSINFPIPAERHAFKVMIRQQLVLPACEHHFSIIKGRITSCLRKERARYGKTNMSSFRVHVTLFPKIKQVEFLVWFYVSRTDATHRGTFLREPQPDITRYV